MKDNILVSIVVTSYNYQDYIGKTLESLITQTYKNIEIIVVDDGSTDNSIEVIKSFMEKDSRIFLYTHENSENKGLDKSVKLGVDKSHGEWIAFCESDDFLEPNYVEKKIEYIKKFKNAKVVVNYPKMFGDEELVKFKTKEFIPLYSVLRDIKKPKNIWEDLETKGNSMVFSTFSIVMVKSKTLKKCNFNPPVIKTAIDIWLWKQLIASAEVGYIDEELTNWRLHKKSITQTCIVNDWTLFKNELSKILKIKKKVEFKKNIQNLFSVNNEGNHKIVKILGIKIKFRRKNEYKK